MMYAIACCVALAAVLRFVWLDRESLWFDELFTRDAVTRPVISLLQVVRADLVHPPLYYLLVAPIVAVAGDSPLALRVLSLAGGLLLVAGASLFAAGEPIPHPAAAWATGLLVAVSPQLVYYAQEARGYTLYTLFVLGAAWFTQRMLMNPEDARARWGLTVCALLAVLTHYVAVLFLVAIFLFIAVSPHRRKLLPRTIWHLLPAAAAVMAWVAWLVPVYRRGGGLSHNLGWMPVARDSDLLSVILTFVGVPDVRHGSLITVGVLICIAAAAFATPTVRRRFQEDASLRYRGLLAATLALLPPLLLFAASSAMPVSVFDNRHLLPACVFMLIALGMVLGVLLEESAATVLLLALCLVLPTPWRRALTGVTTREPMREIAAYLAPARARGEPIRATWIGIAEPVNYYFGPTDSTVRLFQSDSLPCHASMFWLLYRSNIPSEHGTSDSLRRVAVTRTERQFRRVHAVLLSVPRAVSPGGKCIGSP